MMRVPVQLVKQFDDMAVIRDVCCSVADCSRLEW